MRGTGNTTQLLYLPFVTVDEVVETAEMQMPLQASGGNEDLKCYIFRIFVSLPRWNRSGFWKEQTLSVRISNSLIMSQFIDESAEDGDSRNPIAPPVTSLEGAMVISLAGTKCYIWNAEWKWERETLKWKWGSDTLEWEIGRETEKHSQMLNSWM